MNQLKEENIVKNLVLCVLTFGIYYFFWQYRQLQVLNILLREERHGMLKWFFLSFITFGIYHFYHEYKASQDIIELQEKFDMKVNSNEYPIFCLIISMFGFFLIVDFIHQEELNKMIRKINKGEVSILGD